MKGGTEMFLVKQAQRGDADAFVALIEKYKMDLTGGSSCSGGDCTAAGSVCCKER